MAGGKDDERNREGLKRVEVSRMRNIVHLQFRVEGEEIGRTEVVLSGAAEEED